MNYIGRLSLFAICAVAVMDSSAENVAGKIRIALQVGGHNSVDEIRNDSANVMSIADQTGGIINLYLDPRSDASTLGNLEIKSGTLTTLSAQYAINASFIVEGSVGYQISEIGDLEVHEITSRQSQRFAAGDLTRIPLQFTGVYRFRPGSSFNPFVGVGIGYSFVGFEVSPEFDQLSLNLDRSAGRRGIVSTLNAGGTISACGSCESVGLEPAHVDVNDAFEWHLSAGAEYSFARHWATFVDLRYVFASRSYAIELNGGVPIGVPVENITRIGLPHVDDLPGPMFIEEGGLLDLDGDGTPDPGQYYVQDGDFEIDGPSVQIGIRFTF